MSGRSSGQSHDQYSTGAGNSFPNPYITAVFTTFCMLHKLMKSKIQLLKLSVYFLNLFLQSFICQLQTLKAFPSEKKSSTEIWDFTTHKFIGVFISLLNRECAPCPQRSGLVVFFSCHKNSSATPLETSFLWKNNFSRESQV